MRQLFHGLQWYAGSERVKDRANKRISSEQQWSSLTVHLFKSLTFSALQTYTFQGINQLLFVISILLKKLISYWKTHNLESKHPNKWSNIVYYYTAHLDYFWFPFTLTIISLSCKDTSQIDKFSTLDEHKKIFFKFDFRSSQVFENLASRLYEWVCLVATKLWVSIVFSSVCTCL